MISLCIVRILARLPCKYVLPLVHSRRAAALNGLRAPEFQVLRRGNEDVPAQRAMGTIEPRAPWRPLGDSNPCYRRERGETCILANASG